MDSINYFLRVKKEDIYLICPYFEAFEGMAAIRTPKPEAGPTATLKLMVSPDFKNDFDKLLTSLKRRLDFEQILAGD
ncbi:MAG: DUF4911 domain-containing protein [Candidatus Margulisbacteria bacterium]|nr:DUF4911 domain-containing protein [Candidatus Margulisiibacteriota bacterium]